MSKLGRAFWPPLTDWERSCGPFGHGGGKRNGERALSARKKKRNLEADRKKIEAQAKRNNDETLNLQRIRKFVDDNAYAKVEAYKRIQEKWIKNAEAKIQRINDLARGAEEIKTYLDMENGIETIQPTDWVAEMEKHEMKPTGYIKTALEAPQGRAQAPGQGLYHVTKKTRLNAF